MDAIKSKIREVAQTKGVEALKHSGVDVDALKNAGPVTVENLPLIIYQNPNILPAATRSKLIEGFQNLSTNIVVDIITGVGLNLLANRLYPSIRSMPTIKRLPVRWTLFTLPFGGSYPLLDQKFNEYKKVAEGAIHAVEQGKKLIQAAHAAK